MAGFISLKDHVYNYIADQIGAGNLKQEEKINENKICEELNISRTPVREALIQLATEGVLENVPRKGFVLRRFSRQEAEETYVIIGALDGLAASLAVPHMDEKSLRSMEFYVGSMNLAIEVGNYDMYYRQQEEFHEVYLALCGNESLVEMLRQLKKKFLKKSYQYDQDCDAKAVLSETNEEHRMMMELFQQKDGAALEKLMRVVHWKPDRAFMESI